MSRGTAGWLSCATVVFVLHTLGFSSPFAKQIIFAVFALLHIRSDISVGSIISLSLGYLQYAVILLGSFLLARCLLATANSPRPAGPGQVMLFPCKTTHSRLFPKKHSFVYSYLVVGIPVGWEGISGGLVSSYSGKQSWLSFSGRGWYHVDPADYLNRGDGQLGLRGKLDAYLKSQDVDPGAYPYAYLVTAARFLGYHFNPVSFWYLYSADMSLGAMVLEVNNTFDERRMYFLTAEEAARAGQLDSSDASPAIDILKSGKPPLFKKEWPKDFHVSPFNSRKGSYSLLASDPLKVLPENQNPIDNTITLKSSKGHGKIVARLISEGRGIDPSSLTLMQKIMFLSSWCWVGFITFPRIVKEAGRLWFQRKLHVWYKPEPLKESMGRHADSAERQLETVFREYLRDLVNQCQTSVAVEYIPSGIPGVGKELMLSRKAKFSMDDDDGPKTVKKMEFKVLTPCFYTRFVFYAHDLEALFSELRESCTVWISPPDILPKLLFKKPAPALEARSPLDFLIFKAICYLRRRPEQIVRPLTSGQTPAKPSASTSVVDIRDFRISSMDAFILRKDIDSNRRLYRSLVLRLLVADRLTFGSLFLVDTAINMFQAWLSWTVGFAMQGEMQFVGLGIGMFIYGYY